MPLAARVGDKTGHGTPLGGPAGLGSPDVLIGGQPAWRATIDAHTCPAVTGVVPHVGGVVAIASTSVFINKFAAARQGDQITEGGPPNPIVEGCLTVLIGG